jgi:hypothetical protein
MNRSVSIAVVLLFSSLGASLAAGCLAAEVAEEGLEGPLEPVEPAESDDELLPEPGEATPRIYGTIEAVLPVGDHDGRPGAECVALLDPEHRLRKIILIEPARQDGKCSLADYASGGALSFTWEDTEVYWSSAGIAALRAALGDRDGAVHCLIGETTSEARALASLLLFSTLPDAQQASQAATFAPRRVHSLYDFEGEAQVKAEAAYQAVRVTRRCDNPGTPRLESRTHAGFVYGYTASNSGSCQGGWFSRRHTYDRYWRLIGALEYAE